jgi:hypothetical protein
VSFETYLESKKIDSSTFKTADAELWKTWESEFSEMHPASFTAQKLYLINPIRRLYPLPFTEKPKTVVSPVTSTSSVSPSVVKTSAETAPTPTTVPVKTAITRPVFKPKPKTD